MISIKYKIVVTLMISSIVFIFIEVKTDALPQGIYFVDAVNGSDVTGIGSSDNPWQTITHANSMISSGDTLTILPGVYNSNLGESFPIGMQPGVKFIGQNRDTVILDGISDFAVIYINGDAASFYADTEIRNMTLRNGKYGLHMYVDHEHETSPTLDNILLTSNVTGLYATTTGTTFVYGNVVVSPTITNIEAEGNSDYGIYFNLYAILATTYGSPTIESSYIHHNGTGLLIYSSENGSGTTLIETVLSNLQVYANVRDGIQIWANSSTLINAEIESNVIRDNGGKGIWQYNDYGGYGTSNVTISNSVVTNNNYGGIYLDTTRIDEGGSTSIINCSIINNKSYGIRWNAQIYSFGVPLDVSIVNTLLWNDDDTVDLSIYPETEIWTTNEIQYSNIKDGNLVGQAGNISETPLFIDDYHLYGCSPEVDAGTSVGASLIDIDGDSRPVGSAPDIGADEAIWPCYLDISKTVSESKASLSDILTYTISLTNTAVITPLNILMTDTIPSSVNYVPNSLHSSYDGASINQGTITWSGIITPNQTITTSFAVEVAKANTLITNEVLIDAGVHGPYRSNLASTWIDFEKVYLPTIFNNYCSAPIIDDFSNPASGWPVSDTGDVIYRYLNGEYNIYHRNENQWAAVTRGDYWDSSRRIEVQARVAQGSGAWGLVYHLNEDWSEFNTFEIYPDDQIYAFWSYDDVSGWTLRSYQTTTAIRPGNALNTIRFDGGANDWYSIYINDVYVAGGSVPPIVGRVGLTGGSFTTNTDIRYDNYVFVDETCPLPSEMSEVNSDTFENEYDVLVLKRSSIRRILEIDD